MATLKVKAEDLKPGDVFTPFNTERTVEYVRRPRPNRGNYVKVEYIGVSPVHGDAFRKDREFDVERPGEGA